ncbi:hydrogenase maturation nickel metallochaperone HypA [Romboutsia maritimum]|uniref:Hydrogenase maturation factor HypA n=1 Tax=Romboutsia maritimum TaxID=2020948 RepID=A0A371IRN7_9FIRM|nr:hydrogenase maturation nickel metallochaperone HypA [Romboutsia maritimum]RDY23133.1 hydrogenase maturation nickel metallochaperone HypA [Romboutsia maritimum]
MHEISIVYDTLQIANENGEKNNIKKIDKIFMKIGEFTCVEESSLKFAFESLKKNTICEDAELIIEKIKAKALCNYCNKEFIIDFTNKLCPKCNRYSSNITSGYEIMVWQIEGE